MDACPLRLVCSPQVSIKINPPPFSSYSPKAGTKCREFSVWSIHRRDPSITKKYSDSIMRELWSGRIFFLLFWFLYSPFAWKEQSPPLSVGVVDSSGGGGGGGKREEKSKTQICHQGKKDFFSRYCVVGGCGCESWISSVLLFLCPSSAASEREKTQKLLFSHSFFPRCGRTMGGVFRHHEKKKKKVFSSSSGNATSSFPAS